MNADPGQYRIHGLQIQSDLELDGDRLQGRPIDAWVKLSTELPSGAEPGDGDVVAEFVTADRRWYTATETGAGYLLRFHGTCDVLVDPEKTTLSCRPEPETGLGVVPLLVSGTGLAFLLGLRGSLVLHASAVQIGRGSVALAGLPGMGKSTLAAILCSEGGRLLSDDALRVDVHGVVRCFRGTSRVRLRQPAGWVLALYPDVTPGTSPDARLTLEPTASKPECILSAVVIPHLSRDATRVIAQRIDPAEAVFRLSPFLRIARWRAPDLVSRHFRQLGELASRVPTFMLTVPWVPPFTRELASELSDSIEALT